MANTVKKALEQAKIDLEGYTPSKLPEMVDRSSTSFRIASSCAKTGNIYNPTVLSKNKYNNNFLLHLRSMEIDAIAELLSEVLVPVMEQEGVVISIITSQYGLNFKIISNVELGDIIHILRPVHLDKDRYVLSNGKIKHIYNFSVELTL